MRPPLVIATTVLLVVEAPAVPPAAPAAPAGPAPRDHEGYVAPPPPVDDDDDNSDDDGPDDDVYVRYLRRKLGAERIVTLLGMGYRLDDGF